MAGYSLLDQLLHRMALQFAPVAELSFDLDQRMVRADPKDIVNRQHVFVSGLARAGTTVLMRRLHGSGAFRSLTYRDMPFVLAPNLWRRLAGSTRKGVAAAERAHGDGILVDLDSPESLDEVFWRVFGGEDYIRRNQLAPHVPDPETTWNYVRYINAILNAQSHGASRYLSKNNNNILRLGTIRRTFPQALILIPFRDPVSHAGSLLRQHRHFLEMQAGDPFVGRYMTWLGHHEFGHDHRPMRLGESRAGGSQYSLDRIEYWLDVWRTTYGWLEDTAPVDAVFVCYEDLCGATEVWSRLAEMAEIPSTRVDDTAFRLSTAGNDVAQDPMLIEQASEVYARLVGRARAALGVDPRNESPS